MLWGTGAQNQRYDWTMLKYVYIYIVAGLLFQYIHGRKLEEMLIFVCLQKLGCVPTITIE